MSREDIIRMAREAGLGPVYGYESIERFATLVAAAERNKLAAWMIQFGFATGHGDTIEDLLVELEWQVREAEREACAKVCEFESGDGPDNGCCPTYWNEAQEACAAAIRARGAAT